MRPSIPCLTLLSLLALQLGAAAQQPPTKKGAFDKVIKQPTGRNGYEELVLAGDILQESKAFKAVDSDPNATLAMKRDLLADRRVAQVLKMLQDGLRKPVGSPREKTTFDTALPEISGFLPLSRLLAMQQYVFLADGRVTDALANARLALRLGHAVQTDTLLSGAVGVRIGASAIQPLGAHLDQLSARDAETLYNICLEWLRQPSPEIRMMEMERRNALQSLEALRGEGADKLIDSVNLDPKPKPDDDDRIRKGRVLAGDLRSFGASGQAGLDQLYAAVAGKLNEHYAAVLEQLRLPLWQRHTPELNDDGSLAARLASALAAAPELAGNLYARDQARIRLLACHAAVLRYRWEHNKVPPSLAELNLGDMTQDPFTGKPLEYEPLGVRYRLVSAGPEAPADNPKAINGRLPVSVTPGN